MLFFAALIGLQDYNEQYKKLGSVFRGSWPALLQQKHLHLCISHLTLSETNLYASSKTLQFPQPCNAIFVSLV